MVKSPTYRASSIEFDGAAPLYLSSGEITFNTVSQTGINFMVPWNCGIQKVYLNVRTTATATDLFMHLGTTASAAANLSGYRVDASTAGIFSISTITTVETTWVTQTVSAGNVFRVTFTTGATAVVAVTVVLNPNIL